MDRILNGSVTTIDKKSILGIFSQTNFNRQLFVVAV
jgi:hypothetical protein